MNKLDLIEALQNETDLTKSEAEAVVKLFFNEMANTLAKGDCARGRATVTNYNNSERGLKQALKSS